MEMKAAILAAQGEPLVIDSVQLPRDLSTGQVLVRVHYTSVCGSQVAMIDGKRGKDPYLPHLLGHEGSGTVEAVGPGVRAVTEGDCVVLHCGIGEGIESETPNYQWQGKLLNAGWVTTFNQYAIVSENRLTPIPADFDMRLAPLFGCATLTGLGAISKAGIEPGNSVVILGAGGVGLNLIQGAALVSAQPIVAVDLSDEKLNLARQLGATHCVNAKRCDLSREIPRIVGDTSADVVIDSTGHVEMFEMAYKLTRTDGMTMLISGPKVGYNVSLNPEPLHFGRTVTGFQVITESRPHDQIPRYIKLANAGKLKLKELITDSATLDDINTVVEKMRNGELTGRCIIELDGS
jgi:S-(hydroxymethyl)glutathione dehydrogenase/alcohol dehydrogenase